MLELPFPGRTVRSSLPSLVMGILNVTPDSFSDGGRFLSVESALHQARRLIEEGADILDIGGESTRPGARPVSVQEEIDRILPVLEAIRGELDICLSVDTSKPDVMRAALEFNVDIINDVNGLRSPGVLDALAGSNTAVCIMHMQGEPRSMQKEPTYEDVVAEVTKFLLEQAQKLEKRGFPKEHIIVDPGFGFGKKLDHNRSLFQALSGLAHLGYPVLVGVSRKSMIGSILDGREISDRVFGSVAAALLASQCGARILRVHDVRPTVDALKVMSALQSPQGE